MKLHRNLTGRTGGNTLMLCVVMMGLIAFLLAVYLTLVRNQNHVTARSQGWNSAMPIIEAGLEDALAHINRHGSTNLGCDGWTLANGRYSIQRSIGDGHYLVRITNYGGTTPIIESLAYVPAPRMASAQSSTLLANATQPSSTVNYLGRGVRVTLKSTSLFTKGMVAKDSIDLNGNNVTSDSFDSSDPLYSTNGLYSTSLRKDHGDIAVNNSLVNALNMGDANIYGSVSTGPNGTVDIGPNGVVGDLAWAQTHNGIQDGHLRNDMNVSFPDVEPPWDGGAFTPSGGSITNWTYIYTTNGNSITTTAFPSSPLGTVTTNYPVTSSIYPVGSPGPITSSAITNTTSASTAVSGGYPPAGTYVGTVSSNYVASGPIASRGWFYNYNQITGVTTNWTYPTFTDSTSTITTNGTPTITDYDYILDDGNWEKDSIVGTVYVRGNAKLYVTSTLSLTDVTIANGKRLDLYCAAASAGLSGNHSANSSGLAASFHFWGLPTCTSITFSGNSSFTGAIYAPNASFGLNGSGNTPIDFIGASITKSVVLNGRFNFHYDEALAKEGGGGYIVGSWNEMSPSDVPAATTVLSFNP